MNTESLLLAADTRVTCPACGQEFSLEQGFAKQALDAVEMASANALAALKDQERAAVEKRAQQLAGEQSKAAQRQVENMQAMLKAQADAHTKALTEVRALTEQSFKPQLDAVKAQVAGERQEYEKRLADSQVQLKALRDEQLALREERQKLKDEKDMLALAVQKQVDAKLADRVSVVRTQEQEKAQLDKAQLQKKLDDAMTELASAQRRMAQGSQQLQGEVLELAIEDGLKRAFPLDAIEEVKKGARGGDIIHRVTSRSGQPAGVMLWESKRAKDWSPAWIAKLKEDMRGCGADIGVLVSMTTAVPREWPPGQLFGLHEEVWVTTWSAAVHLAEVLRAGLLDVHKQRLISAGKGEKMEALYDYLTSPQFAQKLKAVYGAFQKMREELESERSVTLQRWARREKQLQSGLTELLGVAGDIQGLAQQALPALELEPPDGRV
ncbi:MAG TPA: DUF2130 domain-containing protein [Steroidobacteraceae bacterium]